VDEVRLSWSELHRKVGGGERGDPNSRVIPASVDGSVWTDGQVVVPLSPCVLERTGSLDLCAEPIKKLSLCEAGTRRVPLQTDADKPFKNVSNNRIGNPGVEQVEYQEQPSI